MKNLLKASFLLFILITPLAVDAQVVVHPNRGGTGNTTAPSLGEVLTGTADGIYTPQATSTLGIEAGNVELSASGITRVTGFATTTTVTDVQAAFDALNRTLENFRAATTVSDRALNVFNDTFNVDAGNYNVYVGKNNIYGAARDKNVFPTLPSEAVITAAGGSYPVELEFQHLGGTARDPGGNTNNNLVNIQTQNNEELREGGSTGNIISAVILRRGDIAVFSKSAAGQPWVVVRMIQDPRSTFLPDGVFTLNQRTISIAPSEPHSIFGLRGFTTSIGDAFEVVAGGVPAGADFPPIAIGDVLVSKVANASTTLNAANDDWLVIKDARNLPLTFQEIRFLSQIQETTGTTDRVFLDTLTGDALVWLSPAVLTTAPFLTPSADGDNPRTPQTVTYVGGREDVNADNQFTITEDRRNAYIYLGISPAFIFNNGTDNIDIVVRNVNGTEADRFTLTDDFVFTDESDFTNSTVRHYFYSTDGINPGTYDYVTNQTIEIWDVSRNRTYTFSTTTVDVTGNVRNLAESQLSPEVQRKLNRPAGQGTELPPALKALNKGASVATTTHTEERSNDSNIDIANTFVFLKNKPDDNDSGVDYPVTSGKFVNEIGSSTVSFTAPATLSNILLKNQATSGVATYTNNILEGAAVRNDSFRITQASSTNFRFNVGMTFYPDTDNLFTTHLVGVYETATSEYRPLIRINSGTSKLEVLTGLHSSPSYVELDGTILPKRLHKVIVSFRTVGGVDSGTLEADVVVYAYDANGNPRVYDENTVSYGVAANGFNWNNVRIGQAGGHSIIQNVQGFVLNGNTPLFDYPRHADLRSWVEHHDDQFDDYVWDLVSVANTQTERVIITEPVQFTNLLNNDQHPTQQVLPDALRALNNQATVSTTTNTYAVSNNTNIDVANTFVYLKNNPDDDDPGVDYPISLSEFVNEIATSTVNVTPPGTLSNVYLKNQVNGIESITNGAIVGAAVRNDSFLIEQASSTNFRFNVGFTFYPDTTNLFTTHLVGVFETASGLYRPLLRIKSDGRISALTGPHDATVDTELEGFVQPRRLHKLIVSFRRLESGANPDHLEADVVLYAYDEHGNPTIYDENNVYYEVNAAGLEWDNVRIGQSGGHTVIQNVQGFALNGNTPLFEYPLHRDLHNWLAFHDDQFTDYIWDNVSASSSQVEKVTITESVEFTNPVNFPEIFTGTGVPSVTPDKVGDIFVDTSGKVVYIAIGTGGSGDWEQVSN